MSTSLITIDRDKRRDTRKQREVFQRVRNAERGYAAQLRKIARHVGDLIRGLDPTAPAAMSTLQYALQRYSDVLRPWARAAGERMVKEVARRDELAWRQYSKMMGVELRRQIQDAPIGEVVRRLQEEQVALITSLPIEAGRRVQEIARGTLYSGARPETLAQEILRSGHVAASRATLIARTETAKAASILTEARAAHVGSPGYIWRTVHDSDVRKTHREMEGKFIPWNDPPVVEPGKPPYHAGQTYNCRCFAEPILPDDD